MWSFIEHFKLAKMAKNHDFSDVVARYGATRFFTEKRAVSVFLECQCLTSCQKSKKSLERLLRTFCDRLLLLPTDKMALCSTEVENCNVLSDLLNFSDFLTCWTSSFQWLLWLLWFLHFFGFFCLFKLPILKLCRSIPYFAYWRPSKRAN